MDSGGNKGAKNMKIILSILAAVLLAMPCLAWETIYLAVPKDSLESVWRDALAILWCGTTVGTTEIKVPYGRIDVMTDDYVVEIDFVSKWCEGFGQALFYANSTGKQGVCALVMENPEVIKNKLEVIENLLNKYDIALVILLPRERGQR